MTTDASSPSAATIAHWLTENIARLAQLPPDQIDAATPVVEFGIESLALLGLAGDLAAWLNRDISPTLLWEHPAIAALAAHLDETPATTRQALVPLQTRGDAPPFYFIHDVTGALFSYSHVLKHMGKERMLYAFEAPFNDESADQIESIEALATRYVAELRAHQSDGPYFLGGYSMGGLLAFEMARQLRAHGQTIGLLALIDTKFPGSEIYVPGRSSLLQMHLMFFIEVPRAQRLAYLQRRFRRVIARLRQVPLPPRDTIAPEAGLLRSPLSLRLREVATRYHPGVFDGSLVYLRATKKSWTFFDDIPSWRRVVRGLVHTRPIPGRHGDITRAPNAAHLAVQLNRSLRRAQSQL